MAARRKRKQKPAAGVAGPVEIPDAEHELVIERVAAIDVAKATGKVCVRLPGKTGRRFSRVWDLPARTGAITELGDQLTDLGIEKVTVESTSDYWRIWYYLLEAAGLSVQLVNARDVKNVPGRPKTDKLDAVWLAKLTEKGLLRPSFVPPPEIRRLRDYTRMREDLTRDRTRYWQRLEKLLEDALIKISSVASTMITLSTRDMVEALIAGEHDPYRLAELARGKMRSKRSELITALDGRFDEHHAELARMLLSQIDALDTQIHTLTMRIEELINELPEGTHAIEHTGSDEGPGARAGADSDADPGSASGGGTNPIRVDPTIEADSAIQAERALRTVDRLDEIPGISVANAQDILAEIGTDMSRFPTPEHLVSWAKLCPRTIQSGPVTRASKTGKGNPYLKGALGEAAAAAAKTDTFLGERYRRLAKRRGKLKALVAVARSILVVIWHLLANPLARFRDLGPDYHTNRIAIERKLRNHIAQLTAMGYQVTLEPAA
ncbi:IS110 family transposase [Mycolicibacterium celeriflavum]|nr:IS110 family transposase [Mycolicibacterium celeriflavum]